MLHVSLVHILEHPFLLEAMLPPLPRRVILFSVTRRPSSQSRHRVTHQVEAASEGRFSRGPPRPDAPLPRRSGWVLVRGHFTAVVFPTATKRGLVGRLGRWSESVHVRLRVSSRARWFGPSGSEFELGGAWVVECTANEGG